ncbi:nitrate/nitrite transporter [Roseivirga sp. E12]|uniref:MFS transporter n=1 Tax=Roseivirga sp. E12 TaxID=2819237 RepID=UPI001ABBF8FD|nr:MFS transporter [Roseivirga sp. E12]MBO3697615.1 MFS transporter [Roseivirga sp. E12]
MSQVPKRILPAIVFAQFAGTSLWFAGNAILPQLQSSWDLPESSLANVTSMVMLGFITGTFLFALFSVADRFKPSRVFLACSILGASFNLMLMFLPNSYFNLLLLRFMTGIFIAGIYPVGMKISADWFGNKLGKALGYLVGALVIGSAFPHLLNHFGTSLSWEFVLIGTSILALLGGITMILFVGEGPHRVLGARFEPGKMIDVFRKKDFRSAAFGYFGHMWELYTLWAFIPVILLYYNETHSTDIPISLWTFLIIAMGSIGCVLGGVFSVKLGSAKVALRFLFLSGVLCLASPLFYQLPEPLFLGIFLIWGFAVIGDSAQFSSLNALTAPPEFKGTALTIAVSIGFLLTIPSIQLLSLLTEQMDTRWLLFTLVIGPIFGLLHTRKLIR